MSDFTMPSLGADMESGTLLEWLVHPGDRVHRGDLMAVVDTDKAAVEIESFSDGIVDRLLVEPGTRVPVGAPLAVLADGAGASAPAVTAPDGASPPASRAVAITPVATPPVRHYAQELGVDLTALTGTGRHGQITRGDVTRAAAAAGQPSVSAAPTREPARAPAGARTRVSPLARRLAAELGVDLARVHGAGPDGAIREADVRAAAESPATAEPSPSQTPPGTSPAERSDRRTIAALMSRSKREIPHYYVATTIDLLTTTSWLHSVNRELPVADRIVPAAALLRAVALGLRQVPELNGFWLDNGFVSGEGVHLGVAISVRNGALVAPAIHDATDLGLPEVMAALRDLVRRARTGRLTRAELTDPTVTVTDLGDQGVEEVIGVITPPQVALIGIGRIVERPWAVAGLLGVRPVVRMTLSGDHRATDGRVGARFLALVDELLQRPEEL
jgi:pyruvate dehydrogenase E2 component (dihydrolipoamide acetyltransferase)